MKKLKTRADKGKSEATIEGAVARYATEHGLRNRKYRNPNVVGGLDRIFLPPGGRPFWIEFKREKGGKISHHQQVEFDWLIANGYEAYFCNDIEYGKGIVDYYCALR